MHLGIIPDGNRRYASENGIGNEEAYRKSKDVIIDVLKNHRKLPADLTEVTFYLLSEENLRRKGEEIETVFELLYEHMEEVMEEINGDTKVKDLARKHIDDEEALRSLDEGFSFNWARTKPEAVPEHIRNKLEELEERFSDGERRLNALISYTGKSDIVNAIHKAGSNPDVKKKDVKKHLEIDTDIDFVVRTGDNPRRECLSGFPIWQSSYSEFYHIKKHFPAVEVEDVIEAFEHYNQLRRRKGA